MQLVELNGQSKFRKIKVDKIFPNAVLAFHFHNPAQHSLNDFTKVSLLYRNYSVFSRAWVDFARQLHEPVLLNPVLASQGNHVAGFQRVVGNGTTDLPTSFYLSKANFSCALDIARAGTDVFQVKADVRLRFGEKSCQRTLGKPNVAIEDNDGYGFPVRCGSVYVFMRHRCIALGLGA